jgi:NADPH:quinone reductase-like Zn-dependent oxidoreductase
MMLPTTMRAVVIKAFGGPEQLELVEVPIDTPAPGEVLIEVHTVAANRQDTFTMSGRAQARHPVELPHILGIDPAGVIVATTPEVTDLSVGDRVVVKPSIACGACDACRAGQDDSCGTAVNVGVHRKGGMAEYVTVPARNVFSIADAVSFADASAIVHSFPVAMMMLRERAGLRAGELVLVTGASGAIGSAAIQLAKLMGSRVLAAAGGADRVAYARTLGPDAVIDYSERKALGAAVRELEPGGVDLYVESAGDPAIWREAMSTLARRGRAVVVGSHAGGKVYLDLNWLFRNRISILGASGSSVRVVAEILDLAADGRIQANIHTRMPLDRAREAFEILAARANRGKVILEVRPSE